MPRRPIGRAGRVVAWVSVLGALGGCLVLPELFPGNTPLYEAIGKGDEAAVRRLLKSGADPNSRSRGFRKGLGFRHPSPPLLYAIWSNQPGAALQLVEAGADANARNPDGQTALIAAVNAGMTEVVQALIRKGADVHATSTADGETPLRHGPRGPGGWYPNAANQPKGVKPEIQAILERAGAR
jgi:ankyrin repeat protein